MSGETGFTVLQLRNRAEIQERELKAQLTSVQEEAKKQVQEIASQLHSKASLLVDKEAELADVQQRLAAEIQVLTQQLSSNKSEQERAEVKHVEVRTVQVKIKFPYVCTYVCMMYAPMGVAWVMWGNGCGMSNVG